jgi:hypothetical protein
LTSSESVKPPEQGHAGVLRRRVVVAVTLGSPSTMVVNTSPT